MSDFTKWFQERREERLKKQQEKMANRPGEEWRKNTDVLGAYEKKYGSAKKGLDHAAVDHADMPTSELNDARQSKYFSTKGMGNIGSENVNRVLRAASAETAKDAGTGSLSAYGTETGTSHNIDQARKVAEVQGRKALAKDMVGHVVGRSGGESFLNALGLMTADQKAHFAKQGVMGSLSKWGIRAGGAFNIHTAITSDSPIVDTTATIMANYGMQAGWRAGKAAANVMFGAKVGHMSRYLLGGTFAAAGLIIPTAVGELINDMTSQDSHVMHLAKEMYKQESYVEDKSTQMNLTMRQAGLRKLSSSHLNDRGQLLGNEAAILKGASY